MENRLTASQMGTWVIISGLVVTSMVECHKLCDEIGVGETLRVITLFLLGVSYLALVLIRTRMMRRKEAHRKLIAIRVIIVVLLLLLQIIYLANHFPQQSNSTDLFGLVDTNALLSLVFIVIIEQLLDVYMWFTDFHKKNTKKSNLASQSQKKTLDSLSRKIKTTDRSTVRFKGHTEADTSDLNSV